MGYADCTEKSELEARLQELRANPGMARRRSGAGANRTFSCFLERCLARFSAHFSVNSAERSGGGGPGTGGRPPAPDRPTATRSNVQSLGKNPDGSSGGELGVRSQAMSRTFLALSRPFLNRLLVVTGEYPADLQVRVLLPDAQRREKCGRFRVEKGLPKAGAEAPPRQVQPNRRRRGCT